MEYKAAFSFRCHECGLAVNPATHEDLMGLVNDDVHMRHRIEYGASHVPAPIGPTTDHIKLATLKSISRGFGGDNATYKSDDGEEISVGVGWALLTAYVTTVFADGKKVAQFDDREYIQPHIALARLGYEVIGAVDFAASTLPIMEDSK